MSLTAAKDDITIGVLALQGAFEEHQEMIEKATGCKTIQVRKPSELDKIDGIILPGGESTAMGLIGSVDNMWTSLQTFVQSGKPTWGTCAGMILLAERCVGGSAVIENGQSLIGGMDVLVCRNYFGSQISSFEMATPPPPGYDPDDREAGRDYPGVFIRAPAILNVSDGVDILGKVVATPCRQAAVVLRELETKIAAGEDVVMMEVVDALQRTPEQGISYTQVIRQTPSATSNNEHHDDSNTNTDKADDVVLDKIELPGAADGTNAREVICAARKDQILITSFHPELTGDFRWHAYFHQMVLEATTSSAK